MNRLSIGLQSLDADRLRFLGRLHDPDGALRALEAAVAEMPRVSGDSMFGMPGQRAGDFAAEVDRVLDVGVRHVSAYALTVEPATQFGALHRKGKLTLAPEDDYAETFVRAEEVFAARGLAHYEVSNYAAPGEESRHNLHYWRGGDYLGLGAGAVGCLVADDHGARRYRNDPRPERYLERPGGEVFEETLTAEERIEEALMLGLRTSEGVDLDALEARTGLDPREGRERALNRRLERGDVTLDGARLRVPPSRWLMLDAIVADSLLNDIRGPAAAAPVARSGRKRPVRARQRRLGDGKGRCGLGRGDLGTEKSGAGSARGCPVRKGAVRAPHGRFPPGKGLRGLCSDDSRPAKTPAGPAEPSRVPESALRASRSTSSLGNTPPRALQPRIPFGKWPRGARGARFPADERYCAARGREFRRRQTPSRHPQRRFTRVNRLCRACRGALRSRDEPRGGRVRSPTTGPKSRSRGTSLRPGVIRSRRAWLRPRQNRPARCRPAKVARLAMGFDFTTVSARGLVKVYGPTRALVGVDATFEAGSVSVIEGPNGSGKSTFLGLLAQLIRPTRGEILYGEHASGGSELRAQIGVLAHAAMIYPDLTGLENLLLYARLHEIDEPESHVASLRERFEIGRWGERPARTYSRGQLQRISLARALIDAPRLLLLDEPSTGLDTAAVERLERAVAEERERGAIVVLITHDAALGRRLADRSIRLHRGKVVQREGAMA